MPLSLSINTGTPLPNGQVFPLDNDSVVGLTLDPLNPIFVGSVGVLDAAGAATATFYVPPLQLLSGLTCYSSALTIDTPTFPVVRTIIAKPVAVPIL